MWDRGLPATCLDFTVSRAFKRGQAVPACYLIELRLLDVCNAAACFHRSHRSLEERHAALVLFRVPGFIGQLVILNEESVQLLIVHFHWCISFGVSRSTAPGRFTANSKSRGDVAGVRRPAPQVRLPARATPRPWQAGHQFPLGEGEL